jgi:DNA-binding transcriptional regulator YiaG
MYTDAFDDKRRTVGLRKTGDYLRASRVKATLRALSEVLSSALRGLQRLATRKEKMPNIASALKAEISRVARKEMRSDFETLRKATTSYRHEIAALKKRIQQIERQVKQGSKREHRSSGEAADGADDRGAGRQLRFSATRFAAQRKKLGLSAAKYAKLLNVSSLSIYKWESGQTRPRRAQLEAIAAIRNLGKREAAARLEQLEAAE